MMREKQKGIATVEFAVIGALFFVLILGVIEVGRVLWAWETLTEATRRGARVAVVCPLYHSAIARVTVFEDPGSSDASNPILPDLSTSNVAINYLQEDGVTPAATFLEIRYVRVAIQDYQYRMLIPPALLQLLDPSSSFNPLLAAPAFETILPRESLGIPRDGVGASCFGTAT